MPRRCKRTDAQVTAQKIVFVSSADSKGDPSDLGGSVLLDRIPSSVVKPKDDSAAAGDAVFFDSGSYFTCVFVVAGGR